MNNRDISLYNPSRIFSDNFIKTFFDDSDWGLTSFRSGMDIYEDENNVVVKMQVPGFRSDDFDISIEDNILTVTANAKSEEKEEDKKRKYYYQQIRQESFARSVALPVRVMPDQAQAEYKDGLITITVPKSEEVKPKKVTVKANN